MLDRICVLFVPVAIVFDEDADGSVGLADGLLVRAHVVIRHISSVAGQHV